MLTAQEREELRERVDRWFELPLILAAVVLLLLIVIEATQTLQSPWDRYIDWIGAVIWLVFALEFGLRLWLSRDRLGYVREHWLDAAAVALPALRVFRVVRALRAARALRAVRLLVFGGRGASELAERLRSRKLGKLAIVTIFVVLLGGSLLFLAEAGAERSPITSFGDALYWATVIVVGTEGGLDLATAWGRVVNLVLIAYSLVVFSYVIGAVASLFVETDRIRREEVRSEQE